MTSHVLIADDELLIRQSIRGVLAQEGYEVVLAASGAEAWSRFREDRPDIVVLDLVLGDADGLDLLRRIRGEAPDTKVVIMSAHGSIESAVTAMKLGAYDFIKKPFELEEIVAAVRNAERTSTLGEPGRLPGGAGSQTSERRHLLARGAGQRASAQAGRPRRRRARCRPFS